MALAITVTPQTLTGGSYNTNIKIDVSGLTGSSFYKIKRTSDGKAVRGADMVPVIANTASVADWELQHRTNTQYTLESYNASSVLTASVTSSVTAQTLVSGPQFWIKNTETPEALNVIIGDWSETDYDPAVLGSYKILGRANPVVFTDAWGARTGSFSIQGITLPGMTTPAPQTIEGFIKRPTVLLFQSQPSGQYVQDMYFTVTSFNRTQYNAPHADDLLEYTYQVGFQEVDRPPTLGQLVGFGTWGDLKADPSTVTWADVASQNASWLAVLNRYSN